MHSIYCLKDLSKLEYQVDWVLSEAKCEEPKVFMNWFELSLDVHGEGFLVFPDSQKHLLDMECWEPIDYSNWEMIEDFYEYLTSEISQMSQDGRQDLIHDILSDYDLAALMMEKSEFVDSIFQAVRDISNGYEHISYPFLFSFIAAAM